MNHNRSFDSAITSLRAILVKIKSTDAVAAKIVKDRDEVHARYQPVFAPENLPRLSEAEFRQFLMFRNNRHWMSLQRMGPSICADMDRLREALAILLDESRPIADRMNQLVPPRGPALVSRLSKAVLTPILMICYPERYGVWNQVSEAGMKALALWPDFERGETVGTRYEKVNAITNEVSRTVGVDLWTLDTMWWRVEGAGDDLATVENNVVDAMPPALVTEPGSAQSFGLERHLQEFLRDNWDKTTLGKTWRIYDEDGDPEAGYEYPCSVGRIDLLARHRTDPRWLVVELKRGQSSDQTVGQVLRYMGWVAHHLAQAGETVEGLVIAQETDDSIRYALSAASGIRLHTYEVSFQLKDVAPVSRK